MKSNKISVCVPALGGWHDNISFSCPFDFTDHGPQRMNAIDFSDSSNISSSATTRSNSYLVKYISVSTGWIGKKYCSYIHGARMMNPTDFSLLFH